MHTSTEKPIRSKITKTAKGLHWPTLLTCLFAIILVSSASYSAGKYSKITALLADDILLAIDGQQKNLRNSDKTPIYPISYKGTIYLPMRAAAQLLQYEVTWTEKTKTIDLKRSTVQESQRDFDDGQGYASLTAISYSAASALRDRDFNALSTLVHPTKGVRFSFNGEVVKGTDQVLKATDLSNSQFKSKIYNWGVLDGSPSEYKVPVTTFLGKGKRDFETASRTGWNQRVTTRGNSLKPSEGIKVIEGAGTLYSGMEFVEYYYEGDSTVEFDWYSDILIFEKSNDQYYLVGILLNYWLI